MRGEAAWRILRKRVLAPLMQRTHLVKTEVCQLLVDESGAQCSDFVAVKKNPLSPAKLTPSNGTHQKQEETMRDVT